MPIVHRMLCLVALGALLAAPAHARPVRSSAKTRTSAAAAKVTPHGVWLGTSAGARCFVMRKAGALDVAALESELRRLRGEDDWSMEIAAVRGVSYQEVVRVMDVAIKVGWTDMRLGSADDLAVAFDDRAAARTSAPAHCPAPRARRAPVRPDTTQPPLRELTRPPPAAEIARRRVLLEREVPLPPLPKRDLSNAPLIIVTKMEVTLQGRQICAVAGIADGSGVIQPLLQALEARAQVAQTGDAGVAILQADESLDAAVIERVIKSSQAAGYSELLFAVRSPATD